MAVEGEYSFVDDGEGVMLQGILGIPRVITYRHFLSVLDKATGRTTDGELHHSEIGDRGGNVLGRVGADWRFNCDINPTEIPAMLEFVFRISYRGAQPAEVNFAVAVDVVDKGGLRGMVPAALYMGRDALSADDAPAYRAFRSDRLSHPAVFGWADRVMACLTAPEAIHGHPTGVFFRAGGEARQIGLHFPFRGEADGSPAQVDWLLVKPGDRLQIRFRLYFGGGGLHGYNDILRDRYYHDARSQHCHPWMEPRHACDLAAQCLMNWHYDSQQQVLYDTCPFEPAEGGERRMHTGRLSGAHCAHALLWYGRKYGRQDCVDAAVSVLDKIASGLAPLGTFWPQWHVPRGWMAEHDTVWARNAAETTLFMVRAFARERAAGFSHPDWERAARASLEFARKVQRDDGCFGSSYDVHSGAVKQWGGAGGLLWVAAFAEARRCFGEEDYLADAVQAASYYAQFIQDECVYCATDAGQARPSAEDGYSALLAYVNLSQESDDVQWLDLAKSAADWTMTFRWCYNVAFGGDAVLAKYDFRTRGADAGPAPEPYLQSYGLICHPELMELGRQLGDAYYLERARDHIRCFRQFIARHDGDFGAREGMSPARFYQADNSQPKGHIAPFSEAWTAGLILYAHLWKIENGG